MPKCGFIAKVMKTFKGFDKVVSNSNINYLSAKDGACLLSMKVEPQHTNAIGNLHHGFSATLVDVASSMALFTHKLGGQPCVSMNLNVTYLKGATVGDEILIESRTVSAENNIGYLEVKILDKNTNDILVQGEHSMYLLNTKEYGFEKS